MSDQSLFRMLLGEDDEDQGAADAMEALEAAKKEMENINPELSNLIGKLAELDIGLLLALIQMESEDMSLMMGVFNLNEFIIPVVMGHTIIDIRDENHTCSFERGELAGDVPETMTQAQAEAFQVYERNMMMLLNTTRLALLYNGLELVDPPTFPEWDGEMHEEHISSVIGADGEVAQNPREDNLLDDDEVITADDLDPEWVEHCVACGKGMDACGGHHLVDDPIGYTVLRQHERGNHEDCDEAACEEAREES